VARGETNIHPASAFCRLCREGRLFEAVAWLEAGKPAQFDHKNIRCTPLGIAIDRGFHSLVEVQLKHGFNPTPKHLAFAVRMGRVGIVELLLEHGADVHWLSFEQVTYWSRPEVLKMFIERGADTCTGYPIAQILKRAPRAFLGIYKSYHERFPDWQFQADMALRHFCGEGSIRGVCLLLWLKANPRAKVPVDADEDQDMWESGLWQACVSGHTEIVKKIGPTREEDDLDELLRLACYGDDKHLLEYLVELGANPNAVPATGETALRSALWAVELRLDSDRHEPYRCRYRDALDKLKHLVGLGARLNPDDTEELRFLRRCLVKLDWPESYDLIKFLQEHNFADRSVLVGLLKEPKIRQHLEKRLPALARVLPELKKWAERYNNAAPTRR
jgi:hypothetical protein